MIWYKKAQAAVPAANPQTTTYTIAAGDTLAIIAQKLLGNQGRWQEIKKLNPGLDERKLQIGQVINVPANTNVGTTNTSSPVQTPKNTTPSASSYKIADIKSTIMSSEGFRSTSYFDPRNQTVTKAVGYGFNLSRPDASQLLANLGLNKENVYAGTEKINEEQAKYLLDEAIKVAHSDAMSAIPNLNSHPETVKAIMVDMAYNMGGNRLSKFKKMITALNAKNYKLAAAEMMDSDWAKQVGNRARRLSALMESIG